MNNSSFNFMVHANNKNYLTTKNFPIYSYHTGTSAYESLEGTCATLTYNVIQILIMQPATTYVPTNIIPDYPLTGYVGPA